MLEVLFPLHSQNVWQRNSVSNTRHIYNLVIVHNTIRSAEASRTINLSHLMLLTVSRSEPVRTSLPWANHFWQHLITKVGVCLGWRPVHIAVQSASTIRWRSLVYTVFECITSLVITDGNSFSNKQLFIKRLILRYLTEPLKALCLSIHA